MQIVILIKNAITWDNVSVTDNLDIRNDVRANQMEIFFAKKNKSVGVTV